MVSNKIKRCLSLVMALALTFSLLPLGVMAEEAGDTQSADGTASPAVAAETTPETTVSVEEPTTAPTNGTESTPALDSIQAKMNGILEYYLGTADLTAEEVPALVAGLNPYDTAAAEREIYELDISEELQQLTDTEKQLLVDTNLAFCAFADEVSRKASVEGAVSTYTTVNVLDGKVSVADSANSNTVSGGTVTIKASGNLFGKKTNNITITNKSGSKAELSFNYSASTYNSFTIAGASVAASGSYTVMLDAGGTLSITIVSNSGFSNTTATLTLSNFKLVEAKESSNVTINYDSALGSVTAGGTAVASGTTQEVSLTDGIALGATAASGATFHGWINEADGSLLSTSTSYTLKPSADLTVKAVFSGTGTNYFAIGAATQASESVGLLGMSKLYYYTVSGYTNIYDDLNDAATAAAASSLSKVVIPLQDVTLAAGNYTIPAGVTLLIPFDTANTMYTTQAQSSENYSTPTAFRTLTLADGANMTINGSMSLSAKTRYAQGSKTDGGSPTGKVSFVNMQGSSSISVNNGGKLYAYGFITGSGSVTAKSGATVYECFQIMDCRGGSQMTDMDNQVFPLSQYYVQNIEVPLTMEAGATEYAFTTVFMSSTKFPAAACFIGPSSGMFRMTTGSVTKYYDGSTDRLYIEMSGDGSLANIKLDVGTTAVDSSKYDLAINSNITVTIKSGSNATIKQDLAMLPGAEVIIENGATCTLASGYNLFVYDADTWGNYCYSGSNKPLAPLTYAPSKKYTRTAADLVDAKVCVDGTVTLNGSAYTTTGGANIYSTGTGVITTTPGTQTVTYQLVQGTGYTEIPLTPAKLKNADGTYQQTTGSAGTYHYDSTTGRWYRNLEIKATNIAVGSGLDLHFYVNSADMMEGATYTAVVTKKFADGRADSVKKISSVATSIGGTFGPWADEPIEDSNGNVTATYKEFVFEDISAKEMTDPVEVKIYLNDKDGKPTTLQVNTTYTETVQNYAIRTFADIADKTTDDIPLLRTALADMLYYGAAAQQYFNYNNTDATLATTSSADNFQTYLGYKTATAQDIASYLNVTEANSEEKLFVGNTVSATNTLMFTFYFGLPKRDGYSAIITYTDHNGNAQTKGIDGPDFYERTEGSLYGVDVLGMSIVDGRSKITCKLYNCSLETAEAGGVEPIVTVVDSVEGYARRMNANAIFVEMMKFVDSAAAYFDKVQSQASTS